MAAHERRPTVNRIDSKDELFTEKREKEAKLNIFAPLVNGHFHYFGCFRRTRAHEEGNWEDMGRWEVVHTL
jgi:hypothetical protein